MDGRSSRVAPLVAAVAGTAMLLATAGPAFAGELCGSAPLKRPGMAEDADRRWTNGASLAVLFLDGPEDAWGKVAGIANQWTDHANLTLTYHAPGTIDVSQAQIRASFGCEQARTAIGTDATVIVPPTPTLCLPDPATTGEDAFHDAVLHHFGHALGLAHPAPESFGATEHGTRLDANSIMVAETRRSAAGAGAPRLSWVDREAAVLLYPGHAPVTMTVGIRDACPDGETARYRIFDATRGEVWPAEGDWGADPLGATYLVELTCAPGARICHGATAGETHWGMGLTGDQACEDCCFHCAAGTAEPWVLACGDDDRPRKVALKAANGRYVTAALASGEDGSLRAISPRVKPWERFLLELADGGGVTLKAADGRYVRASAEDGVLRATETDPVNLQLVELGGGQIALGAGNGQYAIVGEDTDATLRASVGGVPGPTGKFELVLLD